MNELLLKFEFRFGEANLALLENALAFADRAHANQLRESDAPYIEHPVAVAAYLLEMGLDMATVVAALLHDTIEDGDDVTTELLEKEFGREVALLVDGVTKLTKSGKQTYITKKQEQSENLRKLFLAIAADVRVVIIKLADRLHNMRTLAFCAPAKQTRIAKETLEVYAPLAHRFGMGAIRSELEDLSFAYLMPEEFEKTRALVGSQQAERVEALNSAMRDMEEMLTEQGIEAKLAGRPKHIYSVYRKMQRSNAGINEVYDLIAIRVIVDSVNDCYGALGVIHAAWKPLPGRFKDYIAMPKPNMYRSLHTTLMSPDGIPFEVQLRTQEMHEMAEYGIAAHWMYKEGRSVETVLDKKTHWLRQVLEANEMAENSREFTDSILKDFLGEYVFVLSPQGEIFDLPVGSTPLDFAYRIHTNIGHRTQHARVNGAMVRLDYILKTNDVVEILTGGEKAGPSRDWLNIVKTQSAKSKIRQWFKRAGREENIQKGREMLEAAAKRQGQSLAVLLKPEYYQDVLKRHNFAALDDMYSAIGFGGVASGQILHKLMDMHRKATKLEEMSRRLTSSGPAAAAPVPKSRVHPHGIVIHGDPGMAVRFSHCCNPLPGDAIVGYITRGRGVSIHRADCKNVRSLGQEAARMIDIEWAAATQGAFTVSVRVHAVDRVGSIMEISKLLVNQNISVSDMNCRAQPEGHVIIDMSFTVQSAEQLALILQGLKKLKVVMDVYRIDR
ncbi:MAG: bifunctional (p)ppGpp synthetase/guanosine-3',5'-bis(diphosphate) 3'-pyrophosphohydrolase [Clostridiales bacterium]|nr:bifunctional (p)ppGpp synthetase/guanosine-3',5'-bis(diphosphate) 3'-pyrophosphohydrolase [Clostridiales bacterium]